MLGPLVENMVLLQKERDRRRRMAVLPEVSRVIAGRLDVGNLFQALGAAVRTVLDFDLMLVRPIGASGRCSSPRSSLEICSADCSRLPNTTPTGSTRAPPRPSSASRFR